MWAVSRGIEYSTIMSSVLSDTMNAYRLATLGAPERRALRAFLERNVANNLFALSWLENYGIVPSRQGMFHYRGMFNTLTEELEAVALVISDKLILFDTPHVELAAYLGRWYCEAAFHFQHVVSARHLVEPFWATYTQASRHLDGEPYEARLISPQQMYELSRQDWLNVRFERGAQVDENIALREANMSEMEAVFLASARMHHEETLEDPLVHQPEAFRHHVKHRIQTGRTYVWFNEHRRLIFKADISAQSRYGVQISGVYTDPSVRNQGVATRAMRELCRLLFVRGWPRVTLYVNEGNQPALKVYERVGFSYLHDYMTIFVSEP